MTEAQYQTVRAWCARHFECYPARHNVEELLQALAASPAAPVPRDAAPHQQTGEAPAAEYLAKVYADPRRAAALERARGRAVDMRNSSAEGERELPLILKCLAEWEDANGSLCAITTDEWMALRPHVTNLAVVESPRMARAALSASRSSASTKAEGEA